MLGIPAGRGGEREERGGRGDKDRRSDRPRGEREAAAPKPTGEAGGKPQGAPREERRPRGERGEAAGVASASRRVPWWWSSAPRARWRRADR
ncbi:hypothetical protein ACN28S_20770 [Cystobacter fuscus]